MENKVSAQSSAWLFLTRSRVVVRGGRLLAHISSVAVSMRRDNNQELRSRVTRHADH